MVSLLVLVSYTLVSVFFMYKNLHGIITHEQVGITTLTSKKPPSSIRHLEETPCRMFEALVPCWMAKPIFWAKSCRDQDSPVNTNNSFFISCQLVYPFQSIT